MDHLTHVVIFTGDMAGQRRFYEEGVGLGVLRDSPEWVEFGTLGATLALHAMADPARHGVQLRFATDDLEARVQELSGRGVTVDPPGIEQHPWGSLAHLSDPEGNTLMLMQLVHPHAAGAGPALSVAINCRDMEGQKRFYRDTLGLAATLESAWWVQLAAGNAGLGLHPRAASAGVEDHHGRAITIGLAVPELAPWYEESVARGVAFTGPPSDRGYGTFADAADADGNPVTFRESAEPETLEEQLAEPFEDEAAPARTAMRKPVSKRAKATSRVATRPVYRARKPAKKRAAPSASTSARASATPSAKRATRVTSPRGTGPAGTRVKPKRKRDPKRARTKPATGRRKKAERRTFKSKKQAVAGASRRKPVKRASRARTKKRVATRGRTAKR